MRRSQRTFGDGVAAMALACDAKDGNDGKGGNARWSDSMV
jgi:hypothetical protein